MAPARSLRLDGVDPRLTLWVFGIFPSDPTHRWGPDSFARAVLTPDGPGTVRFTWSADGEVDVEAWGDGADWLLERAPSWLGADDDLTGFDPGSNRRLDELWRRHRGLRLAGSGVVWQELACAILGQRVTVEDAAGSWRRIAQRWGEPAPGPCELVMPPRPDVLARLSYVELHGTGVERRRADVLVNAAKRANRLEEAATMTVDDALVRLTALPGIGPWTATTTLTTSRADPDVVILGDEGLPTLVSYVMTGDGQRLTPGPEADARMMELLAPFSGHRWRVIRLLFVGGMTAPRRAPRARNPRIAQL